MSAKIPPMANVRGPQPDVRFCPSCQGRLRNVPRDEMKSRYVARDGTVPPDTHTYKCVGCGKSFEINQKR